MAELPDEPPPPDKSPWLTDLANRVRPPDTPMVMQPGNAERAPPLPTYDTQQAGLTEAGRQMRDGKTIQDPGQQISKETRQTFDRMFGNGPRQPEGTAPEDTLLSPSNDPNLTPGD